MHLKASRRLSRCFFVSIFVGDDNDGSINILCDCDGFFDGFLRIGMLLYEKIGEETEEVEKNQDVVYAKPLLRKRFKGFTLHCRSI